MQPTAATGCALALAEIVPGLPAAALSVFELTVCVVNWPGFTWTPAATA